MKAVIYARFSCSKQREASIEDQLRVCRQWCAEHRCEIVAEYSDAAISGRTDERPEFQRMVANAGESDIVLVYMMDRFSRDPYDAPIYKKKLKDKGVKVVSATEAIPDGPESVLLEKVYEGLAAVESAHIAERTRRGMEGNALRCLHNGVPVFGYRPAPDGTYEVDEAEAAIVREVYARHIAGEPSTAIARELAARGVRTSTGRMPGYEFVNHMVHSEKYRGVYTWGKVRKEHGMPSIISDEDWERAQAVRPAKSRSAEKWRTWPLAGKCVCAECGMNVVGSSARSHTGKRYDYYRCGHCKALKPVRADWLESEICAALRSMLSDDATVRQIADIVAKYQSQSDAAAQLQAAERARDRAEAECGRFARAIGEGAPYDALRPLWDDAIARKEAAIADIERLRAISAFDMDEFCAFLRMGANLTDAQLLDAFVSQCIVSNDAVIVKLNYDENENEPAQLVVERVRDSGLWLPRHAGSRTLKLAAMDGCVLVGFERAA